MTTHHPAEILGGVGLRGEWRGYILGWEKRRYGVWKDLIRKQPPSQHPPSHLLQNCTWGLWWLLVVPWASQGRKDAAGWARVLIWRCQRFSYHFDQFVWPCIFSPLPGKAESAEGALSHRSFWRVDPLVHSGVNPKYTFQRAPSTFLLLSTRAVVNPPEISFTPPALHSLHKVMRGTQEHTQRTEDLVCPKVGTKWSPPSGIVNAAALLGLLLKWKRSPFFTCCSWGKELKCSMSGRGNQACVLVIHTIFAGTRHTSPPPCPSGLPSWQPSLY